MLPLILIGIGAVSATAGAVVARRRSSAPTGPTGSGANRSSSTSSLQRTAQWDGLVAQLRGDVPAWLLLGHIVVESSGNPNEVPRDKNGQVIILPGRTEPEKGLLQIDPDTSKALGFDHGRMFEPAYNIAAGVKMYQHYAQVINALHIPFGTVDDFWRAAYYVFAIGFGSAKSFIVAAARPVTWPTIASAVVAQCGARCERCKPSRCKSVANGERVWQAGHQVEAMTRALV